jgi:hypothetical protein
MQNSRRHPIRNSPTVGRYHIYCGKAPGSFPMSPTSPAGGALCVKRAAAAGIGNPYVVIMAGVAPHSAKITRSVGADASSSYIPDMGPPPLGRVPWRDDRHSGKLETSPSVHEEMRHDMKRRHAQLRIIQSHRRTNRRGHFLA